MTMMTPVIATFLFCVGAHSAKADAAELYAPPCLRAIAEMSARRDASTAASTTPARGCYNSA